MDEFDRGGKPSVTLVLASSRGSALLSRRPLKLGLRRLGSIHRDPRGAAPIGVTADCSLHAQAAWRSTLGLATHQLF